MTRRALIFAAIGQGLFLAAASGQTCGNPWTQWTGSPRPLFGEPMAYDSARQKVVFFGGFSSPNYLTDTWEWDASGGGTWTPRTIAGPSGRRNTVLAYDSHRQRLVMFGGSNAAGMIGETWEWDGASPQWLLKSTTGPSARVDTQMAFDEARGKTVLFGDRLTGFPALYDTWEWDGQTWTLVQPTRSPVTQCTLNYDAARAKVLMMGGDLASASWGVWEWSGLEWLRTGVGGLPAGFVGRPVFDPVRGRTLLIGRLQNYPTQSAPIEFWEWDGSAWSLGYSTSVGPAPACCSINQTTVAYDGTGVILMGSQHTPSAQTWRYSSVLTGGPSLLQVPLNPHQNVLPGSTVVFTAQAGAGAAYQWNRNGVPLVDGGHISGAASPTLTINPASGVDSAVYSISAINACGATTHSPIALTVECYANCDGSFMPPVLNASDFQCFLGIYAAELSSANCDGSTAPPILNINDFQCFINAFGAGCP